MDDSCAVCADDLEWVAYGSCGHREVCSTCVVRLRFVLDDLHCCICKTLSPFVFITKAMGDYTRVVTDFSVFPENPSEGKIGQYWYHEDSRAFFDDADHYRMIKAMCRLSCSACDKIAEEHGVEGGAATKRRSKFRNIDQLKGHLFHQHKLFMCNLCLEGRKVFICEQKLYTRSQLNQHIRTGDSEVDGSESERGGFIGHPMCEFCKDPFYGDNELYMHMSRDHYTCHICQRQNPGHYDYYRNYDDLEIHFRQEHFLCEDEACLAKKFVVFLTEAEMKRHNALEHGGNMSRSKRNAILQIPTSFRYRRNEDEQRRRRNRGSRPEPSDNLLSMAIEASFGTAGGRHRDSSVAQPITQPTETSQADGVRGSSESLAITSGTLTSSSATHNQRSNNTPLLEESSFPSLVDSEIPEPSSSKYAQALSGVSRLGVGDASFPPLPGATSNPKSSSGLEGKLKTTLASRLQRHVRGPLITPPTVARASETRGNTSSWQNRGTPSQAFPPITSTSQPPTMPAKSRENGFVSPLSANPAWNMNAGSKMKQSTSAPSLSEGQFSNQAPSAVNTNQHASNSKLQSSENDQMANKSLVERIRSCLGMDEDRYASFKGISAEYRQGQIDTLEYLFYVQQFGLSHLVPELAQLLPDAQKKKELLDTYNINLPKRPVENGGSSSTGDRTEKKKDQKKGKGKMVAEPESNASTRNLLADSFLDTVRKLQEGNNKPQDGDVEVLSKDGYRSAKDKFSTSGGEASADLTYIGLKSSTGKPITESQTSSNPLSTTQIATGGSSKQKKKTSKFIRVRLGDGAATTLLDSSQINASPERTESDDSGIPARGVWRNGGGQRLFTK